MQTVLPPGQDQGVNANNNTVGNVPVPGNMGAPVLSAQPQAIQPVNDTQEFGDLTLALILYKDGLITEDQYKDLRLSVAHREGTEESLIRTKNLVSEKQLTEAKAKFYNIPYVDINTVSVPVDVLNKLDYQTAKDHKAVIFKEDPDALHIAMVDPLDVQRVKYLQLKLGKRVIVYYASEQDLTHFIDTKYGARIGTEVEEALEEVGTDVVNIEQSIRNVTDVEGELKRAPVPRIVNMILEYASTFKASDVHIEPRESKVSIRYRINGILVERQTLPVALGSAVVTRIKILSNLKIDEHRVPQDGRFQIKVGDKQIDLRVSVMPTVYGEKIVIRLLEKGGKLFTLEQSGLRGMALKNYKDSIKKTEGIILITGPTGSGKTQTLASTLNILNKQSVNIVTLEDPVEIRIDGVNQVQVNHDVGLTFAKGLRSFLRQDPDIIMVGEIRDSETAGLAVQAALVGRLVLATLHTNSAAGALPRLLDMEVEPFLLASTINIIVAQRLVRTICSYCKEAYPAPEEIVKEIHRVLDGLKGFDMYSYPKRDDPTVPPGQISTKDLSKIPPSELQKQAQIMNNQLMLYRGKGCPRCNNTGYSGRTGIFEVVVNTEKISKLVLEHRSADAIRDQAIADGMILMKQDGFMKVLEGITTLEEVLRVQY